MNLEFAGVNWTHEELFGYRMTEPELIELLEQLAVEDCVEVLSRLSCIVDSASPFSTDRQLATISAIGFDESFAEELRKRVLQAEGSPPRPLFFGQQITHLTRLALRHCDDRARDHFGENTKGDLFVRALFGVTDLFGHELDGLKVEPQVKFILRQLGVSARPHTLAVFSRYYDLLLRVWPQVVDPSEFDLHEHFLRFSGLTLEQYLTTGFAVYSTFSTYWQKPADNFGLRPEEYFANTLLSEADWRAFVERLTATPAQLRTVLEEEASTYGETDYRAHSFDRRPLIELSDGRLIPSSFLALERAVTEGVFWILTNGLRDESRRREEFTNPFGRVFERAVQEAIERLTALEPDPPRTIRDFHYPKRTGDLSSDMTVVYPTEAFFCEVVTGRPNVRTLTRGDLPSFWADVDRLITKKAKQLARCWRDFFLFGRLKFDGIGPGQIRTVWPVLIMVEEFPLMPPIRSEVEKRVKSKANWPKGIPRLTVLDADELGAIEALVEQGWTFQTVIRRWKREAPELPLSNWLHLKHSKGAGHSAWHKATYRELCELVVGKVFGRTLADMEGDVNPAVDTGAEVAG